MVGEQSAIEDAPKSSRRITLRASTCTACGHPLRGLSPDRSFVTCPECGCNVAFDLLKPLNVDREPPRWRWVSLMLFMMLAMIMVIIAVMHHAF